MAGYPNLFPSGFVETEQCAGPLLYRGQPSRETGGTLLNDLMTKYANEDVTNFQFLNLANTMKQIARTWSKLRPQVQNEFIAMLLKGNSPLSKKLRKALRPPKVEPFYQQHPVERFLDDITHATNQKDAQKKTKELFSALSTTSPQVKDSINLVIGKDTTTNVFVITVVAIVAIIIGFFIAYLGKGN